MIITDTGVMIRTSVGNISPNWSFNTGCESHETGSGCENCDLYNSPTRRKKDEEVVEENKIDKGTACHAKKKKKRVYAILLSTSLQHF